MPTPYSSRSLVILAAAQLCVAVMPGAAQPPPATPAAVARAQTLLTAGHADSAVAILERYFRETPTATAGRLLLGDAYRQLGDLDRALASYEAVRAPRPARLQARFNAAGIFARRGQADLAFEALRELKASGSFDMELVRSTADFAGLRNDPRLDSMMFRPEDFVNPFVEPVRVIHEWVAENKGDQFSWIARAIGDVDGDRVADIVTSAPTWGANGRAAGPGRVYVYSGRSGALLWTRDGTGDEGLGTGLEGAGDVNRDGAGDVIAGAPGAARAYVLSGRDGRVLLTLAGRDTSEQFGQAAGAAGDQNGDGFGDVIVGAPGATSAGPGAGRAYLFSGRDGTVLHTLDGEEVGDGFGSIVAGAKGGTKTPVLIGAPGAGPTNRGRVYVYRGGGRERQFVIDADETGAALGAMFTSLVGDVDGDRVPDVFASDYTNAANGPSTGRIYVHSGATGRRLLQLSGERAGDGFGIGSAEAGDLNGDGHDDIVVGAWQHATGAQSGGKIYVYSGKDGSLIRSITGRIPGETLGFDATGVGDVDGDAVPDLLVTSSWSNIRGFRSGRMFVISGRVGGS